MRLLALLLLLLLLASYTESKTLYKTAPSESAHPRKVDAPKTPPGSSNNEYYPVDCPDGKKYCECPWYVTNCRFILHVEEIQTFTSYKFQEVYEPFLSQTTLRLKTTGSMRTTAGDTYYLNSQGYVPSLPLYSSENGNKPPEYGLCYNSSHTIDGETFETNNCSVPITVDGATFRMIIGVNGQIPGPTLIVHERQIVQVRVVNKLTSEGISVHWHGMHQKGTPWMDGVGLVTQPPIVPGTYFDYVFEASPAGTHWYHSHIGAQRTDGLYGALIVKEVEEEGRFIDTPESHTISLLDWQQESSLNLFIRIHSTLGYYPGLGEGMVPRQQNGLYLRTHSTDGIGVGPVPYWSGLMNGRGRHNKDTFSILSTFRVEPGYFYRFRLIGVQSLYAYKFSVDQHKLVLIATDGHFIEPEEVDFIIIHTGERYDFVLHANQDTSSYWMRAETLEVDALEEHTAEGILVYEGVDEEPNPNDKYTNVISQRNQCTPYARCVAVNCPFLSFPPEMNTDCLHLDDLNAWKLQEHAPPSILQPPDSNLKFFNFGFEGQLSTSAINGMNFKLPSTPYQTYCDQYNADIDSNNSCQDKSGSTYPHCVNVVPIATWDHFEKNRTSYPSVNFVLSAVGDFAGRFNDFSHPIHLHGHNFYVVAIKHGKYDTSGKLVANNPDIDCHFTEDYKSCMSPSWTNDVVPPFLRVRNTAIQKDTVIVPAGGYVVIAFEADNPGYWFLHCHIEAHQLEGMALIVQEYSSDDQWFPPANINKIGNFNWDAEDYYEAIAEGYTCDNHNTTTEY